MRQLPGAVLFACTSNSIRSPMAEAYMKHLHGHRVYVDSVGVRSIEVDGFAIAAMDEIGIDLTRHRGKTFEELEDGAFDEIVTLSPEAHHHAMEMTRTVAATVVFWPTLDPTAVHGTREERLAAYREVRDSIIARIEERYPPEMKPV